jgi:hypothetical protein
MRKETMTYNELAINWTEPCVDAQSGQWKSVANNLTARTKFILARIDLCCQVEEDQFAARVTFNRDYVAMYGAHRCWWFLRETVTENPVLVSARMQEHMDAALARDWPGDARKRWDDDDLNDLGWSRLGFIS